MNLDFKIEPHSSRPVYLQLESEVKRLIGEAELGPGDPLPSVGELARAAQVSVRTMDHALRELIRTGVCYRRPKKGTFVGGDSSRFRTETAKQIVILYVPSFGLDYFNTDQADREIYAGMRREANKRGVDLLLINNDLEYYLRNVSSELRGVLLLESEPLEEVVALSGQFPTLRFVYANYFLPGFEMTGGNVFGVFNDDFGGAFQISSFFFRQGCGNVRVLTFAQENLNYAQRLKGYQLAADQYAVPLRAEHVEYLSSEFVNLKEMMELGETAIARLLAADGRIDLVLSTCDFISFGVRRYLENHPECQVKLAGYDGYRVLGNFPDFSTMQIDFAEIGAQALNIAASRKPCPKQVKIFPNFIHHKTET